MKFLFLFFCFVLVFGHRDHFVKVQKYEKEGCEGKIVEWSISELDHCFPVDNPLNEALITRLYLRYSWELEQLNVYTHLFHVNCLEEAYLVSQKVVVKRHERTGELLEDDCMDKYYKYTLIDVADEDDKDEIPPSPPSTDIGFIQLYDEVNCNSEDAYRWEYHREFTGVYTGSYIKNGCENREGYSVKTSNFETVTPKTRDPIRTPGTTTEEGEGGEEETDGDSILDVIGTSQFLLYFVIIGISACCFLFVLTIITIFIIFFIIKSSSSSSSTTTTTPKKKKGKNKKKKKSSSKKKSKKKNKKKKKTKKKTKTPQNALFPDAEEEEVDNYLQSITDNMMMSTTSGGTTSDYDLESEYLDLSESSEDEDDKFGIDDLPSLEEPATKGTLKMTSSQRKNLSRSISSSMKKKDKTYMDTSSDDSELDDETTTYGGGNQESGVDYEYEMDILDELENY